jgi:hypothetical protein
MLLLQNRAAGFAMRIKSLAFGSAYSSSYAAAGGGGGAAAKDKNTGYILFSTFSLSFFSFVRERTRLMPYRWWW